MVVFFTDGRLFFLPPLRGSVGVLRHPWGSKRRRRSLHPRLNSFRRYAALSRPYRAPILMLLSVGCALFECLPTATKSDALRAEMPLRGPSEAAGGTPGGTSEVTGGTRGGTSSFLRPLSFPFYFYALY